MADWKPICGNAQVLLPVGLLHVSHVPAGSAALQLVRCQCYARVLLAAVWRLEWATCDQSLTDQALLGVLQAVQDAKQY